MEHKGQQYTFVRREGIAESFGGLKNVKDFKNLTEATVYLKELFADYADQYPELFAKTNRYDIDSSEMFPMINKWAQNNNIPYTGWQYTDGDHYGVGYKLYAWLPVRVAGKFACVGSHSDYKRAYFSCGGEDFAHLSVSFRTSHLPIHQFSESNKLKPTSQTYSIDGFKFIISDEGVSIPGKLDDKLRFKNSKKSVVRKFRIALDVFCDEMGI